MRPAVVSWKINWVIRSDKTSFSGHYHKQPCNLNSVEWMFSLLCLDLGPRWTVHHIGIKSCPVYSTSLVLKMLFGPSPVQRCSRLLAWADYSSCSDCSSCQDCSHYVSIYEFCCSKFGGPWLGGIFIISDSRDPDDELSSAKAPLFKIH